MKKEGSKQLEILLVVVGVLILLGIGLGFNNSSLTGLAIFEQTQNTSIYECGNITQAGRYAFNSTVSYRTGYGACTFNGLQACLCVQAQNVIINMNGSNLTGGIDGAIGIVTSVTADNANETTTIENISILNFSYAIYSVGAGTNKKGGDIHIADDVINLTNLNITLNGSGTGAPGLLTLNFTNKILEGGLLSYKQNLSLRIVNATVGEIRWLGIFDGSVLNNEISANVTIIPNSIIVATNNSALNSSANVTLYSSGLTHLRQPVILRNGAECGATCSNFTALNASEIKFNVTTWSNYSVGDITTPNVTINLPVTGTMTTDFYAVNLTLNEPGYCEVSVNGGTTNRTMANNSLKDTFNTSITGVVSGTYTLLAYCNDSAGNKNYTNNITFSIELATASTTSSGGGGANVVSVIPAKELEEEGSSVNRTVRENAKIRFTLKEEVHTAKLESCDADSCDLVFESDPVRVVLNLGETEDIDLDADNVLDLKVKLLSITAAGSAEIEFTKISKDATLEIEVEESPDVNESNQTGEETEKSGISIGWIIGIIVVLVIVVIWLVSRAKRKV